MLVSRVFADVDFPPTEGKTTRKSRFTTARLDELRNHLVSLAGKGIHFGVYYDGAADCLHVVGNLDPARISADALASGEIVFEFSAEGGRRPRRPDPGGAAPNG